MSINLARLEAARIEKMIAWNRTLAVHKAAKGRSLVAGEARRPTLEKAKREALDYASENDARSIENNDYVLLIR